MELDPGPAVSVMSREDYDRYLTHIPLRKSSVKLETYTNKRIYPLGIASVDTCYKGQKNTLSLYIIDKGGPPLFGREWLNAITMNWPQIKALTAHPSATTKKLANILQEHPAVFSPGVGKVKGHNANVTVERTSKPHFDKARPVPYAIRPNVEQELDRLHLEGIIRPVERSKWATPIVPVVKRNGNVRLCGDFKVTINPVLEMDPLPKIEDTFANLSPGRTFSKIDLSEAYLQMEVSDDSKELLTINTHKGLFQYNRLVYFVASAPSIWQRTVDQVLQGIPYV